MPVTQIQSAPAQRALESHELAFNTILEADHAHTDGAAQEVLSRVLNIELSEAVAFIAAGKRLPVARCQTRQEAELIANLLRSCGFQASVTSDEELRLGTEITRARRVLCADDGVQVHHAGGVLVVPASEIRLMVIGFLRNSRIDYSEGTGGSKNHTAAIRESFEFQSEKMLLDVYSGALERSFRIRADSFDYSGLVQPLSFRAEMNFQSAVSALRKAAPGARVDHDFQRVGRLLGRAWPERSHLEARGVRRAGLAMRPVAQASVTRDNSDQFERYSRLMFLSV